MPATYEVHGGADNLGLLPVGPPVVFGVQTRGVRTYSALKVWRAYCSDT
jgi:hypothetical protein